MPLLGDREAESNKKTKETRQNYEQKKRKPSPKVCVCVSELVPLSREERSRLTSIYRHRYLRVADAGAGIRSATTMTPFGKRND